MALKSVQHSSNSSGGSGDGDQNAMIITMTMVEREVRTLCKSICTVQSLLLLV